MVSSDKTVRLVAWALIVGAVLRLAFALVYWQNKPLTHDEQEYLSLGLNLAAGRGFVSDLPGTEVNPAVDRFSRAPLYPVTLAAIFTMSGTRTDRLPAQVPPIVQVVQSLLGVATIWLGSRLARRVAGRKAAVVAAWLIALYPPLIWTSAYALSEAVFTPVALLGTLLAAAVVDRLEPRRETGDVRRMVISGAVFGLAALIRPAALVFIVLAAGVLLRWRQWLLSIALVAAAAAVILPWTLRNLAVHHRFIVIAAEGGVTFWTGNHPLAIGEGDLAANPELKRAHVAFREQLAGRTPEESEPYYYRAALQYIFDHPLAVAWLVVKKFFYTWVPVGPSYRLHSSLYYGATLVSYLPLLLLAVPGARLLVRARRIPRTLLLLAASSVLVGLIFFPQERFRLAVVDPTLCVLASARLAPRDDD